MSWGEKLAFVVLAPVLTPFAIASVIYDEFSSNSESTDFSDTDEGSIEDSKEELRRKKKKEIKEYKHKSKQRLEKKYNFKITFQNKKIEIKEDNLQFKKSINNLINETKELEQVIQELESENYCIWSGVSYE